MKKTMERFRVRIDQNLNRTEKSVALTPDLLKIEETIAVYKQVCTILQKKFSDGLQAFGKGTDGPAIDRRLKKTADFILGQSISEVGRTLAKQNSASCLAQVLVEMGGVCSGLAHNQVQYEISVENIVIAKLQEVLTTDLPNILTGRKQLDRLILELDTIKSRLEKSREEEGSGTPGAAARSERNIEDLDDTARKVEQARDNLASDMLVFLARDDELAGLVAQYLEYRSKLNTDNTTQLELMQPRLVSIRATRRGFPIFGSDLREHLDSFGLESGVAYPLQLCVSKLIQLGLEEEGLFRLAAGSSKVKRLRAEIEAGQATMASLEGCDHHVLTATLKTYLRELPSPLMGEELYTDWLEAANLQGEDRFDAIWNLLQSEHLPRENYKNIHYLFKFLHEVSLYSDVNKMSASNLAIVITPNVIWSTESVQDALDVGVGGLLAQVVELIILQQSWFFQNDPPIVWDDKLAPLGTCVPMPGDSPPSLGQSIANAINIPVSITSSPLPTSRDKNKKVKKAPAPPADPQNENQGSPPGSPVSLRKESPGNQRNDSYHRSRSVEGHHRILQHPSQPPPKPPTNRVSVEQSTRSSIDSPRHRTNEDAPFKSQRTNEDSPFKSQRTNEDSPSKSHRTNEDLPFRSRASTGNASPPKIRTTKADNSKEMRDGDSQPSSGRNDHAVSAVQPSGHVSQLGSVYTVHTSLYPDLHSQDADELLESEDLTNADWKPGFPVPAPRSSKPALPSKPQGLARNMSVRTSSGGGGGQVGFGSEPHELADDTRM